MLVRGGGADIWQVQVNMANTARAGSNAVYAVICPGGQIFCASIDGDGRDRPNMLIGGQDCDLSA